jgi:hypothetical protein
MRQHGACKTLTARVAATRSLLAPWAALSAGAPQLFLARWPPQHHSSGQRGLVVCERIQCSANARCRKSSHTHALPISRGSPPAGAKLWRFDPTAVATRRTEIQDSHMCSQRPSVRPDPENWRGQGWGPAGNAHICQRGLDPANLGVWAHAPAPTAHVAQLRKPAIRRKSWRRRTSPLSETSLGV